MSLLRNWLFTEDSASHSLISTGNARHEAATKFLLACILVIQYPNCQMWSSSISTVMWYFKKLSSQNALPHKQHLSGFSTVSTLIDFQMIHDMSRHTCNISSFSAPTFSFRFKLVVLLCLRRSCLCKLLERVKLSLHSEQQCGFSPVWTLICIFRFEHLRNSLSHK